MAVGTLGTVARHRESYLGQRAAGRRPKRRRSAISLSRHLPRDPCANVQYASLYSLIMIRCDWASCKLQIVVAVRFYHVVLSQLLLMHVCKEVFRLSNVHGLLICLSTLDQI
jgi:hypothetical protein